MPAFEFELEYAKSNRAACKQCKAKIDKGALRIGIKQVGAPAGEASEEGVEQKRDHLAEAMKWHHATCFQKVRGVAWFKKHLPETPNECTGFSDIGAEDQSKAVALFAACRGAASEVVASTPAATPAASPAAASAAADAPKEPDVPASPEATGKRKAQTLGEPQQSPTSTQKVARTGRGRATAAKAGAVAEVSEKAAACVVTEEELKAIAAAKEEFAKRSVAVLGALLAKNGLPKTGRKEELLERVAEGKALGVPPLCACCGKAKLKWSRETGAFACPGFFDDASSRFKRCKGPGEGADLTRTPWEDFVA